MSDANAEDRAARVASSTELIAFWDALNFAHLSAAVAKLSRHAAHNQPAELDLCIRAYGGWYLDRTISDERLEIQAKVSTQQSVLRADRTLVRVKIEFADDLLNPRKWEPLEEGLDVPPENWTT